MSKNEILDPKLDPKEELQIESIFARLKGLEIEASPYLKTKVLAHLNEEKKHKSSLLFWKLLSVGSLCSLILLGFISVDLFQNSHSDGAIKQAYVIHIDFNQSDKEQVVRAEVELPSDVHFASSNNTIREERKLKLPVAVKSLGKGKLPFVVTSDSSGEKQIKVRLLNENDELVREQILKLKFAKQGSAVTF